LLDPLFYEKSKYEVPEGEKKKKDESLAEKLGRKVGSL
jgi:hypothetical protein